MKIILVGMPGSGKSTVGKQLSSHLNLPLIDLDTEIERAAGQDIKTIFAEKGEEHFRTLESRTLQRVLNSDDSFILATGGGAPCFHNGMEIINQRGVSIFLDVPTDELVARVASDTTRPLLAASDKEELLLKLNVIRAKRLDCYEKAQVVIFGSDISDVIAQLPKM